LGLPFEPPHVPIHELRLLYGRHTFAVRGQPVFRVVRRDEFDHWLVQSGQRQGITIRQDEAVKAINPRTDYVEVVTTRATFHARTLVAADGSRSFVRQHLKGSIARPHILLAGDAAGVDPMFREGISFALTYGDVAAAAIIDAFARQDFGFDDYKKRILRHRILSQLRLRVTAARVAYFVDYSRLVTFFWNFAPAVIRVLAWLNPYYVPVDQPRLIRLNNP